MHRTMAGLAVAIAAMMAAPLAAADNAAARCDLSPAVKPGALSRVDLTLELNGELQVRRGEKVEPVKITVAAAMKYDEKWLPTSTPGVLHSIRHYDRAAADIKIGEGTIKPTLRPERSLVGARLEGSLQTLFSPAGPLTHDELDLIDTPGSSLLLDQLLPGKTVATGDAWKHSDNVLCALLGLEKVKHSNVESKLLEIHGRLARMEMSGRVEGTFGGASTEIECKGRYQFDLDARRITWIGLLIKEQRKPGEVVSGIDDVAHLQAQITPLDESTALSDRALVEVRLEPSPENVVLSHQPANSAWTLLHDRKWYLHSDEGNTAVFRLLDEGQYVAQCNLSAVLPPAAGQKGDLDQFKDEVRQALGKFFEDFTAADESTSTAGYKVYRVAVKGTVSDLPVQWIYYQLRDGREHQVVFAFTVNRQSLEQLRGADRKLIDGLRF